jgi:prophage DNA circulation protein
VDSWFVLSVVTNRKKVITNAVKVATNEAEVITNGVKVATNGTEVITNSAEVITNGIEVVTNGVKVVTALPLAFTGGSKLPQSTVNVPPVVGISSVFRSFEKTGERRLQGA